MVLTHKTAASLSKLAESIGLDPKIAIVYGDDILSELDTLEKQNIAFKNMETGERFLISEV